MKFMLADPLMRPDAFVARVFDRIAPLTAALADVALADVALVYAERGSKVFGWDLKLHEQLGRHDLAAAVLAAGYTTSVRWRAELLQGLPSLRAQFAPVTKLPLVIAVGPRAAVLDVQLEA